MNLGKPAKHNRRIYVKNISRLLGGLYHLVTGILFVVVAFTSILLVLVGCLAIWNGLQRGLFWLVGLVMDGNDLAMAGSILALLVIVWVWLRKLKGFRPDLFGDVKKS